MILTQNNEAAGIQVRGQEMGGGSGGGVVAGGLCNSVPCQVSFIHNLTAEADWRYSRRREELAP